MRSSNPPRVGLIVGTRPEAIKMAPVVEAIHRQAPDVTPVVISTGQHREMLRQVFSLFGIAPDVDLDLMQPNQDLGQLTSRVLTEMAAALSGLDIDLLMVQGDTTTAFAAALAGFYARVPVWHVEAGLRSHDSGNPYPEEMNRRLVSALAAVHFAPTPAAADNLLREGIGAERVFVTGNTVVDALATLLPEARTREGAEAVGIPRGSRMLLVTSHRRESWGSDLEAICLALRDLVARFADIHVVYPVHLNPNVRSTVGALLHGVERIHLVPPVDYLTFLQLMEQSHLILTDSGGVQEEAPSLHKPLLVLRKLTERPEACAAGAAKIVGTNRGTIVAEASRLLTDQAAYHAMSSPSNPFGDGRAAARIVSILERWAEGVEPVAPGPSAFAFTSAATQ